MKTLSFLLEGKGDVNAVPALVKRLLTEYEAWDSVRLSPHEPFRIGGLQSLTPNDFANWSQFVGAIGKSHRPDGVLVVLDGDHSRFMGNEFCAVKAAQVLAEKAKAIGAGSTFSLSVVIARQEFESWLLPGLPALAGQRIGDGTIVVASNVSIPNSDLEIAPRDAKKCIAQCISNYRPTLHQKLLAEVVALDAIRGRKMRSFQRLESAIQEIIGAFRSGVPVVSPS